MVAAGGVTGDLAGGFTEYVKVTSNDAFSPSGVVQRRIYEKSSTEFTMNLATTVEHAVEFFWYAVCKECSS